MPLSRAREVVGRQPRVTAFVKATSNVTGEALVVAALGVTPKTVVRRHEGTGRIVDAAVCIGDVGRAAMSTRQGSVMQHRVT